MILDKLVCKLWLIQLECFGDKSICCSLWEMVSVAKIVIEGNESSLIIFLCMHMVTQDILKVCSWEINYTIWALTTSLHKFVEVLLDAACLTHLVLKIILCFDLRHTAKLHRLNGI